MRRPFRPASAGSVGFIARASGGRLREAFQRDDREAALDAFLDLLAGSPGPVVAVIEDLQWADEATLDLVRLVSRRLPTLPSLVIATYRDDIGREHPLQLALGDLVPPTVTRIHLDALTAKAVDALASRQRHRSGRAARHNGRQSLLCHGDPCRRERHAAAHGARCGAGPSRQVVEGRQGGAGRWRSTWHPRSARDPSHGRPRWAGRGRRVRGARPGGRRPRDHHLPPRPDQAGPGARDDTVASARVAWQSTRSARRR